MAEVSWTPQALNDLDAICRFIGRDASTIAAVFARRVFDATERLVDFPESGRMVPEIDDPAVREVLLGNYRIIYRLRGDHVDIVTIHHGARLLRRHDLDSE